MADDSTPPLPQGFALDADDSASSAPQRVPPPPKGFMVDAESAPAPSATNPMLNAGAKVAADALTDVPKFAVGMGENALSGVTSGLGSLADAVTFSDPGTHKWGYQPRTQAGQDIADLGAAESKTVGDAYDSVAGTGPLAQTLKETIPEAAGAIGTITGAKAGFDAATVPSVIPRLAAPAMSAEETLAQQAANARTNMGAAAATADISKASPQLKQAIVQAGPSLNTDVLNRHLTVDTLPMPEGETPAPLRKGQATQDQQQLSDEINLRADPDTQGILSDSITNQDATLGKSMGEIRRRATPDIVQRSNAEHGQSNIDAIKSQDNDAVTDIRAKYKALADQNGGQMPIDTGSVVGQVQQGLAKGFLTKTAANNPVVSEVMDSLNSGKPMSFEQFENARTNLAGVQRQGGSDAAAAGIVRSALENMPLSEDAQGLKDMANVARNAAKSRFNTIEQNPAYEAAVNDNVPKDSNGLHVIGAPSPLADTFMDRYFLGNGASASRAFVGRIKGVMAQNPDFSQSIEAAALNKLRDAAGLDAYDAGPFRNAGFRNARNAMDPKADVLMSPDSVSHTDQLKQASGLYNDTGKASSVNRSNTALTLQRFGALYPSDPTVAGELANLGTDVVASHAGLPGVIASRVGKTFFKNAQAAKQSAALKAAKVKFAQDATSPGAGLSTPAKSAGGSIGIARATGGKVDHDALVEKLYQRWKSAKRDTDRGTKPLLSVPDAAIIKALHIAQEHI